MGRLSTRRQHSQQRDNVSSCPTAGSGELAKLTDRMCTPRVNKEQSHRSSSHTCCSRPFPARPQSVEILSEMMEAQERRPKLYTDTHSHAHSFIVSAFRHILTHCAHSQHFLWFKVGLSKSFRHVIIARVQRNPHSRPGHPVTMFLPHSFAC